MRNISYIFLIFTFITSCGNEKNQLNGKLAGGDGQIIYLEKFTNNLPVVVDSAKISDGGSFILHFPNALEVYRLRINPEDYCVLILDSTDKPEITGDAMQLMGTYKVSGSENSELVREFWINTNDYMMKREEIRNQLALIHLEDSAKRNELLARVEEMKNNFNDYKNSFVDENINSPALLITVNQFDPISEIEYFRKIEKALALTMPNSSYHTSVKASREKAEFQIKMMEAQRLQEEKMANLLLPGSAAPEISLPDPEGKKRSLSDLRGKYVLVDFWASWCAPCRRENPNVVAMYNKYNKKGFDIFSVSLDKDKTRWTDAIKQDGLIWPNHVSDLMMWSSSVVSLYGFEGIPFTVLLDKKGNVIASNLRGPSLEQKLEELLGS